MLTAELATAMPVREGFVYWVSKAWGEMLGFFEGWTVVFIVMIDKALYPVIFMTYLEVLYPFSYWQKFGVNTSFVSICFFVTIMGPSWIGIASKIFAMGVFIPITIYTVMGFFSENADFSRWKSVDGPINISLYVSILLWLYSGYDYSGFLADEIKDVSVTYPRTMFISIFINMFMYLLPVAVSLALSSDPTYFSGGGIPELAKDFLPLGQEVSYLLIGGALFSNMGVYLVYIHTSSNALCSISTKGDAPKCFSWKLPKFHTPWFAVFFYSTTTLLWTLFDFSTIVEVETVLYCVHVIILIASFFKLRISFPDLDRPFKIPGPLWFLGIVI